MPPGSAAPAGGTSSKSAGLRDGEPDLAEGNPTAAALKFNRTDRRCARLQAAHLQRASRANSGARPSP